MSVVACLVVAKDKVRSIPLAARTQPSQNNTSDIGLHPALDPRLFTTKNMLDRYLIAGGLPGLFRER
jgi:hypothetical protein